MPTNTVTQLTLRQKLLQSLGDYLTFSTTTNITTDTSVISTTLKQYDGAADDAFNEWWIYIDGTNNSDVSRKISDYATATGTLTVYGAALAAESAAVTCYLSRYEPVKIERAVQEAVKEVYPSLYLPLDDITLITGNILPDASFEDWSSSTALRWYTTSNITLAQTSTAALFRNGLYSVKATASAANGYVYISSDTYPRLLDLQGQSVSLYVLAYPETADDATIEIYTIQADGTAQTLTSTTTCPAAAWTILKLENQGLNDDLEEIQIRFKVATNAKYVYFDDALLSYPSANELLLPVNFRDGHLSEVRIQTSANTDPSCYDLNPFATLGSGVVIPKQYLSIVDEGNWRYLRIESILSSERRIRLKGFKPLEALSADGDTITLDAERVPLLIEYAKEIFLEREGMPVSSEDVARFDYKDARFRAKKQDLWYKHRMEKPSELLF